MLCTYTNLREVTWNDLEGGNSSDWPSGQRNAPGAHLEGLLAAPVPKTPMPKLC